MRNRKLFKSAVIITTALLLVGCGNKVEPVDAEPTGTVSEESLESIEPTPSPTVEPTAEPEEESVESSSIEESLDALKSEESSEVEDSSESSESAEDESQSTGIEIVEELDKNMYTQNACNARSGDSTDFEKVASLGKGAMVHVTGRTANNWFRVDLNNEVVYISSSLLGDSAPVVQQQASGGDGSGGGNSENGGGSGDSGGNGGNDDATWQAGDVVGTDENTGHDIIYGGSVDF